MVRSASAIPVAGQEPAVGQFPKRRLYLRARSKTSSGRAVGTDAVILLESLLRRKRVSGFVLYLAARDYALK